MDQHTQTLFNNEIVAEAITRYGVPLANVALIGGFQSYVYEFTRGDQAYVLRFTHNTHRTAAAIYAEVDWISYLARYDLPVARAVPSTQDKLVEVIPADEGAFAVVAFEKAPGTHPRAQDYTPALFRKMGGLLGRMHTLTQAYVPSNPAYRRRQWYEDSEAFANALRGRVPALLSEKFDAMIAHLRTLPTPSDAYGLVHIDVHGGNLHLAGDRLTLFDFDDCQYSWFVDDIAMALFYMVPVDGSASKRVTAARTFLRHFLPSYDAENALERAWFDHVPAFLKAREITVCMALWDHSGGDLAQLDDWGQRFMDGWRARIRDDVAYLDLDFEALAPAIRYQLGY